MRRRYTQSPKYHKPVIAWSSEYDGYVIKTPYKEEFVEAMRNDLSFRVSPKWIPLPLKAWVVDTLDIEAAKQLIASIYGDFEFIPKPSPHNFSSSPSQNGHNYYRKLFELAGPELSSKFWKQILQKTHPDIGGSTEQASECNVAWQKIKSELNWN